MPEALLDYDTFQGIRTELSEYAEKNLNLSPNAERIFGNVYNKALENGRPETVAERMAAVALDIASADMKYFPKDMSGEEKLRRVRQTAQGNLEMYVSGDFRANTPTNINMGRWRGDYNDSGEFIGYVQLDQLGSACFVIPIEDTFRSDGNDGLLDSWVTQQQVHKGGGGTGFSFERIRPKGSLIGYNPAVDGMDSIRWSGGRGVASGYESFLNFFYNQATDAVKQGNSRRGANMGVQRVDHMDFLDHLFAKNGRGLEAEHRMKNFNVSLAVTDEFMEAVEKGWTYTLYNPQRAEPKNRRILEEKFGVKNPELVRKGDLATREQFEDILGKNRSNPFNPLTTPNMYLDDNDSTVVNAYNGKPIGMVVDDIVRIDARKVFDTIVRQASSNGEPGVFFIDKANEQNALLPLFPFETTNPCGEQPLIPFGACNLGSINAGNFVFYRTFNSREEVDLEAAVLNDRFTKIVTRRDGTVEIMGLDWNRLRGTIQEGVHFLDNVIDRCDFPVPEITKAVQQTRNIGLGYMGVYDTMVRMKIRYGSDESFEFAEELAKVLHDESLVASQKLAEERGEFPLWEKSFHNPDSEAYEWVTSDPKTIPDRFRGERKLSDLVERERVLAYGAGKVRNVARITQAPTGTIRRSVGKKLDLEGISLDNTVISSGIEPVFALYSDDKILNSQFIDWSTAAIELLKREGFGTQRILDAIKSNQGSVFVYNHTPKDVAEVLNEIPEDVRDVLVTSSGGEDGKYEITADMHVKMLLAFQRYNDSATSKTTNLPSSASDEDVRNVLVSLWKGGAKGGTVYVDQSREYQILNVSIGEEKQKRSKRRPLLQRSITIELPYISSQPVNEGVGDRDFNPDRVFTTIAYNPVNGGITGIFQNIPEVDPERVSNLIELNIDKSRALKQGRSGDEIISDLEKISQQGAQKGIVVDKAVMPEESKERMRFEVGGATTCQARLNSFYIMKFLTNKWTDFSDESIKERTERYFSGDITLKSIINTKGQLELGEDGGRPSILSNGKVLKLPRTFSKPDCPECDPS